MRKQTFPSISTYLQSSIELAGRHRIGKLTYINVAAEEESNGFAPMETHYI